MRLRGRALLALSLAGLAGAGCGKKQPVSLDLLSGERAYRAGMERLSRRDLVKAIETFERIRYAEDSIEEFEPLVRLGIADATFYKGTDLELIDARSLYLDFVTLYGDHPLAPYAQTQAGLCSLRQVNHPSRDQSQTLDAISDLEEVGRRYPDSPFTDTARGLVRSARSRLAESEFLVGRFYMKRKRYLAALERFRRVIEDYPDFPETDKVLYHMGRSLVAMDSFTKGAIYLDQLLEDYPEGEYVKPARKLLAQIPASPGETSGGGEGSGGD